MFQEKKEKIAKVYIWAKKTQKFEAEDGWGDQNCKELRKYRVLFGDRQKDGDCNLLVIDAGLCLPTKPLGQLFNDRQAQPGARNLIRIGRIAIKRLEELFWRNRQSGFHDVADRHADCVSVDTCSGADGLAQIAVLERVVPQIVQYLREPFRIGMDMKMRWQVERKLCTCTMRPGSADEMTVLFSEQCSQIELSQIERKFGCADAGQFEHVVADFDDAAQVFLYSRQQIPTLLLGQDIHILDDVDKAFQRSEWRFDFV